LRSPFHINTDTLRQSPSTLPPIHQTLPLRSHNPLFPQLHSRRENTPSNRLWALSTFEGTSIIFRLRITTSRFLPPPLPSDHTRSTPVYRFVLRPRPTPRLPTLGLGLDSRRRHRHHHVLLLPFKRRRARRALLLYLKRRRGRRVLVLRARYRISPNNDIQLSKSLPQQLLCTPTSSSAPLPTSSPSPTPGNSHISLLPPRYDRIHGNEPGFHHKPTLLYPLIASPPHRCLRPFPTPIL
jgi:hypothetical protein